MYSGPFSFDKKDFVPAMVGAGLSLFLLKSGVFSLFFLVPLGFVAYRCHYKIAWLTFFAAAMGNIILTVFSMAGIGAPVTIIAWEIFYFAVMAFVFTWITAPPPGFPVNVSEPVRLIAGSCLGALVFSFFFFQSMESQGFIEYANYIMNVFTSASRSSGIDVVQSARLEMISAEALIQTVKSVMLRGGSLVACVLLFFICRQISFFLARLSLRARGISPQGISLILFHVAPPVIWVFSSSLLLVVFTRISKLETLEIILWNILIICAILYLVQGLGIMQFFLARPGTPAFLKLLLSVLFIVILFSPFLNAVLLGGLILLGVAENWMPFRVSKQNGPPSTPEAGDGSSDDDSSRQ